MHLSTTPHKAGGGLRGLWSSLRILEGIGGPETTNRNRSAGTSCQCFLVDMADRRDVFHCQPEGLEKGDLLSVLTTHDQTGEEVPQLTQDVIVGDRTLAPWDQEVARLVHRRFSEINEEPGSAHRLGIELSRAGQ